MSVFQIGDTSATLAFGQEEIPQPKTARVLLESFHDLVLTWRVRPAITHTDFFVVLMLHRLNFLFDKLANLLADDDEFV